MEQIIEILLVIKATESCILDYHFLYKFTFKMFFTPKNCQTWLIFSETQIPFSQTQDNTKHKSHFPPSSDLLCLFVKIVLLR